MAIKKTKVITIWRVNASQKTNNLTITVHKKKKGRKVSLKSDDRSDKIKKHTKLKTYNLHSS